MRVHVLLANDIILVQQSIDLEHFCARQSTVGRAQEFPLVSTPPVQATNAVCGVAQPGFKFALLWRQFPFTFVAGVFPNRPKLSIQKKRQELLRRTYNKKQKPRLVRPPKSRQALQSKRVTNADMGVFCPGPSPQPRLRINTAHGNKLHPEVDVVNVAEPPEVQTPPVRSREVTTDPR